MRTDERSMAFRVVAWTVGVIAVLSGFPTARAGSPIDPEPSAGTLVRTYVFPKDDPWRAECFSNDFEGGCVIATLFSLPAPSPSSVERVDLVVTVSFDFDIEARRDLIGARVTYLVDGPPHVMAPGAFRLGAPPLGSATTLSWSAGNVLASGRVYTIRFSVFAIDGTGDFNAAAQGTRATVRVDWVTTAA